MSRNGIEGQSTFHCLSTRWLSAVHSISFLDNRYQRVLRRLHMPPVHSSGQQRPANNTDHVQSIAAVRRDPSSCCSEPSVSRTTARSHRPPGSAVQPCNHCLYLRRRCEKIPTKYQPFTGGPAFPSGHHFSPLENFVTHSRERQAATNGMGTSRSLIHASTIPPSPPTEIWSWICQIASKLSSGRHITTDMSSSTGNRTRHHPAKTKLERSNVCLTGSKGGGLGRLRNGRLMAWVRQAHFHLFQCHVTMSKLRCLMR